MPTMKKTDKRLDFRLPPDLLARLTEIATEHERSLNGELLWIVREYLKMQDTARPGETGE
jgi:hypothetical protein